MARWGTAGGKVRTAGIAVSAAVALATLAFAVPAMAGTASPAARTATAAWSGMQLPLPAGADSNTFEPRALSCFSAKLCAGGGEYQDANSGFQEGALLTWAGKQWAATRAPLPADARTADQNASVYSMACPSATVCFGGGYYENATGNQAMVLTRSGGTWSAKRAPLPADASPNPDAIVTGIACRSASWCMAAGQYGAGTTQHGLLLKWSGKTKTWTPAAAPEPAGAQSANLYAISCPSTTVCFAGGQYADAAYGWQPFMLRWAAGKWAPMTVPLPADARTPDPDAIIRGLACPSATQCVAVGDYYDTSGRNQAALFSWAGKSWAAANPPLPSDAASYPSPQLSAAACPAVSHCTAGGTYAIPTSASGLVLNWSGKGWTALSTSVDAYALSAISCPSVTRCVALSWGLGKPYVLTGP